MLLCRRLPRSTLFPYTTLFRSQLLECLMRNAGHVVTRTMLLETVWDYHFDPQTNVIDVHVSRLRQKIDKGFERPLLDRKSTRLNSSHQIISYAVFCLKKKNNTT